MQQSLHTVVGLLMQKPEMSLLSSFRMTMLFLYSLHCIESKGSGEKGVKD